MQILDRNFFGQSPFIINRNFLGMSLVKRLIRILFDRIQFLICSRLVQESGVLHRGFGSLLGFLLYSVVVLVLH